MKIGQLFQTLFGPRHTDIMFIFHYKWEKVG